MCASRRSLILAVLLLAGCSTQPAYRRPAVPMPAAWANAKPSADATPSDTSGATSGATPASETWWTQLHDGAINELAAATLADNPTLAEAVARIDEARGTLGVNQAQRLPQITANGSGSRAKTENLATTQGGSFTLLDDSASIGPSLAWEIDLWGRLRESARAASDRLDARDADARGIRLSLVAQVADGVLNLRACNYSLAVRDNDIASRERQLETIRHRLQAGSAAPVDEANAASNLAITRTNRIGQQEQCIRQVDALVALSGRDAASVRALVAKPLADDPAANGAEIVDADVAAVMPTPPSQGPALPATVLLAEPSVAAAERELAATWSEIGVARAERLPQINVSAMLAGQWLSVFGSTVRFDTWSIGPSLAAPLFDGGSGSARVHGAEARYREAFATLRSNLRTSAQNVEDALAAQQSAEQRLVTSRQAVDAARITLRSDEARWHAGAITLFELEDARRQFNSAQDSAIAAGRDRAQAWVDLVRASGNVMEAQLATDAPATNLTGDASADSSSHLETSIHTPSR